MEGIATAPRLRVNGGDGKMLMDRKQAAADVPDLPAAMRVVGAWLREKHEGPACRRRAPCCSWRP